MINRLNFIFHAHLPFVRHPEYPKFLEEDWLYEAINESYLPLLRMLYQLKDEKVPFRLTFSISPTLCFMLRDTLLKERFKEYMNGRLELGNKELSRLKGSEQEQLAQMYLDRLQANMAFYTETCSEDILSAFSYLEKEGCLELITTSATHSYLPIYKDFPIAVNAQVETGTDSFMKVFGKETSGFWLPECGYYPGLEKILKRNGIKWTSLSAQAFALSDDKAPKGNFAPVKCPNGVYCFARDHYLTSLVWSATEGYPGDSCYREFYRDIGYDLPLDYVRPYIHEPEVRVFTGFKYWAVTGKTADKTPYKPELAKKKAKEHANDFLNNVKERGEKVSSIIKDDPCFTVSFDAELFGHWWFEGIQWLENIIREVAEDDSVTLETPTDYINGNHEVTTLTPGFSSWGEGGFSQVWLDNSTNTWIAHHAFKCIEHMTELANRFPGQGTLKRRFLNQATRETLLLMASDWPFIIHNHTSEGYAQKRVKSHIQNLNLVYDNLITNAVNTEWLVTAEKRNNIFPDIDYSIFSSGHLK